MKQHRLFLTSLLIGVVVDGLPAPPTPTERNAPSYSGLEKRAPPDIDRLESIHTAGGRVLDLMHANSNDPAVAQLQKGVAEYSVVNKENWRHYVVNNRMDTAAIAALDGFDGVEELSFTERSGIASKSI